MSEDTQPLTPEQIADDLRQFAETNHGLSGARSLRYDLRGTAPKAALTDDFADLDRDLPNPSPVEPDADGRYIWRCSRCGRKSTQSQIGKEFAAAALQSDGRRMASCPWCGGVAYHHDDERRISEEAAREEAKKVHQRKHGRVCMSVATLFFLGLPACLGFLALVITSISVGPLARIERHNKPAILVLAGSCIFPLSRLNAGYIVPDSWMFGYVAFIPCYAAVILIPLMISYVARKIGDALGGLIYRS